MPTRKRAAQERVPPLGLLDSALSHAATWRVQAARQSRSDDRLMLEQRAELVEELVRYCRTRDRALADRVDFCARLQAKLERRGRK